MKWRLSDTREARVYTRVAFLAHRRFLVADARAFSPSAGAPKGAEAPSAISRRWRSEPRLERSLTFADPRRRRISDDRKADAGAHEAGCGAVICEGRDPGMASRAGTS